MEKEGERDMSAVNSFYAFKKATKSGEFIAGNTQGDTLTVQVEGASSVGLQILGQVDMEGSEFVQLMGIDYSTMTFVDNIAKKGIYMFPINGLAYVKFKLNSVAGGEASVFARVTKGD